jgi:CyaY protein
MNETEYLLLVDGVFKRVQDLCEPIDPDAVEAYAAGDVLTLTFADRARCVINTQRSTRQIWMAAGANAWHFRYEVETGRWVDDKGRGEELFATLARVVAERSGQSLAV